ncbi:MAG: phosphotransferase [Thermodesulfobacteriota bacterium]
MRNLIHFINSNLSAINGYSGRIRIHPLKGDGSDRRVFRLTTGRNSLICVSHPGGRKGLPSENDSFFYVANHFQAKGLPAPDIRAFDPPKGLFLMQDFGDFTLETLIRKLKDPQVIKRVYQTVLRLLLKIQIHGAENFNTAWCYDTPLFDGRFSWERESLYFIETYLKGYRRWQKVPPSLEKELKEIALRVDQEKTRLLLYRDFQSRNLMIWSGGIGLIDFQAARIGPPQYDLASLLIDPYVNLSEELQKDLLEHYLEDLSQRLPLQEKAFREHYDIIAFQRNLQVLGAFAYLSRVKGKIYFEQYIPAALASLKGRVLEKIFTPYRQVKKWIGEL